MSKQAPPLLFSGRQWSAFSVLPPVWRFPKGDFCMASFPTLRIALLATTAIVASGGALFAQTPTEKTTISAPVADPAARADPDMAKVLAALGELQPKPIENLTAAEARKQPSATDAVMKVIKDEKLKVDPHAGLSVSNSRFADMGNLRLRYYTPEKATKDAGLPVIVYYRGGGWVISDLDTYDASASAIARKANAIVVSVDYPMAPEHKFPAQHDEAIEAYKYILKNAKGWGGDPAKLAIVGESAGGNLAVATAMAARDQKLTAPVAIVSVYPIATTAADTPSKKEQAAAKPLNAPMMAWFFDKVLNNEAEKQDPRLNLVAADLKGLPPTTIINAEIDPLRSDGDMLADKMKAAGNDVTHKVYAGVTHEFFGMDAVVAKAKEAQDFAVSQLQKSFGPSTGTVGASPSK
ncbi:alpha/beta hydrolase [Tardiphaga sp. vice304]|uniref:alpha/beta hydrolase n=1 Tax=Tardiphaga sp. vice304 TaxID=2592817 RepID=UPI001AEEE065|nr:alpha/beta hydrolase [Tardiphaga sp. vice304]